MSQQGPDRPHEDGEAEARRPAPAGYGVAGPGDRTVPRDGHQPPDGGTQLTPGPDAATVYGRVTRFGAPGAAASPLPPQPRQPHPVPGSWGPTTAGLGGPAPYGPPRPGGPPPWVVPPPPWAFGPPRPQWRPEEYASWLRRVGGWLVDNAPAYVASAVLLVGYVPLYAGLLRRDFTAQPTWSLLVVGMLLSLASTGWSIYNRWVLGGRTGQSVGKRVAKTWLVSTVDGRPVGVLNAFLRDLLHVVDGLGYVGYLWPLWDDQRQTLADKIIQTVVVRTPVPPLTEQERASRNV